jgi:GNAT superfamily N-acetyltransferase
MCSPERVRGVMLTADTDDALSQSIARAHGFQLGGLHLESELDLVGMERGRMEARAVAPAGLTLASLPPDADEATWSEFAELHDRLDRDTPDRAAGAESASYEIIRTFVSEPWQVMGAWNGDDLVGFTAVSVRDAEARVLNTHLTGVLPHYRGRGVATALKAAHAVALERSGWRKIRTQNMEGNEPILASNKSLGFRPSGGLQDLTFDHPAA